MAKSAKTRLQNAWLLSLIVLTPTATVSSTSQNYKLSQIEWVAAVAAAAKLVVVADAAAVNEVDVAAEVVEMAMTDRVVNDPSVLISTTTNPIVSLRIAPRNELIH